MALKRKERRNQQDKVRFSIGTKLITIISIIVIVSLGSITALVSWMVREDLKIATTSRRTGERLMKPKTRLQICAPRQASSCTR